MNNPRDKYLNDTQYKQLVDMLEGFIHQCEFTPSELREAAVLACINYEYRNPKPIVVSAEVAEALKILDKEFANRKSADE